MKFFIEYTIQIQHRLLKYIVDEYSFDIEPTIKEINFEIALNKLSLTVSDNNSVVQVLGFCPYGEWSKANYCVPQSRKGILKVKGNFEPGFSYKINNIDNEFPISVNIFTGWICIGTPEKKGKGVEFIDNCIAVIDDYGDFISLWLKPETLPNL